MRFIIKNLLKKNIYSMTKKAGYYFQGKNKEKLEIIFVRPPHGYPRFHLYVKTEDKNLIFNLHLDQKRPIYKGSPAHAGEYEGETIEKEIERIKQVLV